VIESNLRCLEVKGWKVSSAREFLDLYEQEEVLVELRFKLADTLQHQRLSRSPTQGTGAKGREFE
jgi:hypothetical protein